MNDTPPQRLHDFFRTLLKLHHLKAEKKTSNGIKLNIRRNYMHDLITIQNVDITT